LIGLLTCLALAHRDRPILSRSMADALDAWLKAVQWLPYLWGEAAAAALLPWCVWLRSADATARPDKEIASLALALIAANQEKSVAPLASPYYLGEVAMGLRMKIPKYQYTTQETFHGSAYMAVPALHTLVRTGLKQVCKRAWVDSTRIGHRGLSLASRSDYCQFKVRQGVETTKMFPLTYEWSALKRDALQGDSSAQVPTKLATTPWLMGMWWQVAPHRLNADAMRLFGDAVIPGWGS